MIEQEQLDKWLAKWCDPYTQQPLEIMSIQQDDSHLQLALTVDYPLAFVDSEWFAQLQRALEKELSPLLVEVSLHQQIHSHVAKTGLAPLPQVKNVIAVASGKGGVGKSTTAVNLALTLQQAGAKVAIVDADIYGPSIPMMLNLSEKPEVIEQNIMKPLENYGIQANSIGVLVDPKQPVIWRGPMVTSALEQLFKQTAWQDVDYLLVDLPPGTGDIQLSLAQRIPLTGAVIVTTPQDVALLDAQKGLAMFQKVNVPILGLIENMSVYICSKCGHHEHIFGKAGGQRLAEEYQVPILGALPLDKEIREQADCGLPIVLKAPSSAIAQYYREIARQLVFEVSKQFRYKKSKFHEIKIHPV